MSAGTSYSKGAVVLCPHCSKEQEAPVEDLVIPGCVGDESRFTTDCEWCFEDFTVEAIADGSFLVTKA